MTAADDAAARVLRWANLLQPSLRNAVLAALAAIRDQVSLADFANRLASGDIDGAVRVLFDHPDAVAAFARIQRTYQRGILDLTAKATRTLTVTVQAPVFDQALIAAVRRWENASFTNLVQGVRDGLRAQVADDLARGRHPRAIATALKTDVGRIGLTAYDESLIASYRAKLEAGDVSAALQRTLRDKRFDRTLTKGGYSSAQIDTMTNAYRRKLVAWRAETFARTAALQAANDATQAAWEQAVTDGAVPLESVRRFWIVADDERLCPRCGGSGHTDSIPELNPEGVGLFEPFQTPKDGLVMGPVIHPACRCVVYIKALRAGVRPRPAPSPRRFSFAV